MREIQRLQQQIDDQHGNYQAILPLTLQLIDLTKSKFGDHSTEYGVAINDLAGIFRYLGNYTEAEQLFNQALTILAQTLDVKDPNYTTVLNNLAGLYRLMRNFSEAEKLFKNVIEDYQLTLGDSHFLTLSAKNNLGLVYQDMHRFDEALSLHQTCLIELEPQKHEHPLAYATTLSNIASVYGQTQRLPQAIDTSKMVLTLYQKQVGDRHPLYASALNNLASLYYKIDDFTAAKKLFLESKTLNDELFGTESETYRITLNNIELCDQALQKSTIHPQMSASNELIDNMVDSVLSLLKQSKESPKNDGFGMGLCRRYFETIGFPALQKNFTAAELERMAIGLVGEGSECFGFDDEYSQDHDFGPRLMVWLTDEDYASFGDRLQQTLNDLPKNFEGYEVQMSEWGQNRSEVFTITGFYQRYLGLAHPPKTLAEWRALPESNLATATNGQVFYDPLGKFTAIRNALLKGYTEDVRLKKIAARLMTIAQAGQYNFARALKRHDLVAMNACSAEFIEASLSLVFLLNHRYKPFYKWMHKGVQNLPILGDYAYQFFNDFLQTSLDARVPMVEAFCTKIIAELKHQNLSHHSSDFLLDHGPVVLQKIQDPTLQQSNPWVE